MRAVISTKFVWAVSLVAGQVVDDADERLAGVELAQAAENFGFGDRARRAGVDDGEDAAVHRHQVRREDHLDGLAGGPAENLLDLRLWRCLPTL